MFLEEPQGQWGGIRSPAGTRVRRPASPSHKGAANAKS